MSKSNAQVVGKISRDCSSRAALLVPKLRLLGCAPAPRRGWRPLAWALLVAGHAWHTALAEQRTEGLDTPARLLDAALRASTPLLGEGAELPDPAHFRRLVHYLVHRATAAAAHHSPREREPMVASLARRLPPLFEAMSEEDAAALREDLRSVADRRLIRALDL